MRGLVLFLVLTVSGCGALPIVETVGGMLGKGDNNGTQVTTDDIVVGKKEEDNDTAIQLGQTNNGTIENNGPDWFVILILCLLAGWAIPSPSEMGRGLIDFFGKLRR